jgi:putative redox protein
MSGNVTKAHVSETGESPFAVAITVSGFDLTGDEPEAAGGANLGPAPYDLLTAALAECTAMTVRWFARREGWPLEHVEVSLTHQKGGEGAASPRQDVVVKCIRLTGPELTDAQREKLVDIAARCPVQRTLEGTPLITTRCEEAPSPGHRPGYRE